MKVIIWPAIVLGLWLIALFLYCKQKRTFKKWKEEDAQFKELRPIMHISQHELDMNGPLPNNLYRVNGRGPIMFRGRKATEVSDERQ